MISLAITTCLAVSITVLIIWYLATEIYYNI